MIDFNWSLLIQGPYHDMLVAGLLMSLKLLVIAWPLALLLAIGIALLRLSPWWLLHRIAFVWVEGIRNVPLLAHLLFWYFGFPELLPDSIKQTLYAGNYEMLAALIALTLYASAYMAEDVRSGIRAVPHGQVEAARSLGLGYLSCMRWVVLPQAARSIVPPLISQTLNLWKDTSIATVIGTAELMYQASKVETATFRSAEAFLFATVSYLSVSLVLTAVAEGFQRRYPVRTM